MKQRPVSGTATSPVPAGKEGLHHKTPTSGGTASTTTSPCSGGVVAKGAGDPDAVQALANSVNAALDISSPSGTPIHQPSLLFYRQGLSANPAPMHLSPCIQA